MLLKTLAWCAGIVFVLAVLTSGVWLQFLQPSRRFEWGLIPGMACIGAFVLIIVVIFVGLINNACRGKLFRQPPNQPLSCGCIPFLTLCDMHQRAREEAFDRAGKLDPEEDDY